MSDYDFSSLSPPDFETLVGDLFAAEQGVRVERFGPGKDKGVDLRCGIDGTTVVQCKHYFRSGRSALKSAVVNEVKKWETATQINRYILVTSVSLTVGFKNDLFEILAKTLPIRREDILGLEDLNSLLRAHPRIERANFKLWIQSTTILQRIVNNGLWSRSEELQEGIAERSRFFVQTDKYTQVLETVQAEKFCVIAGPPGVGKSLLAEMVSLAHAVEGWEVVSISGDVDEGFASWNSESPQLFYYDDFLGQTSLAETLGKNEENRLATFLDKVRRQENKRVIMTTREQIFRAAVSSRDGVVRLSRALSVCHVEMEDYSIYDRGRILYNHIFFSGLGLDERRRIVNDGLYVGFVEHANYSPRLIEQVLRRSGSDLQIFYSDLEAALSNPEELWTSSYNNLSHAAKKILTYLTTFPPVGVPEATLRELLGVEQSDEYIQALKILEGTWLGIFVARNNDSIVALENPSCRDFLLQRHTESAAAVDYLIGICQTVQQISLVFEYSQNGRMSSGGFLRAGLDKNSADFVDRLKTKYRAEADEILQSTPASRGGLTVIKPDPRPRLLLTAYPLLAEYASEADWGWFLTQLDEIAAAVEPPSRSHLNAADMLSLTGLSAQRFGDAAEFVMFSRRIAKEADEFEHLRPLYDLATSLGLDPSVDSDFKKSAESILDAEIEFYKWDCSDPQDIDDAIGEIESIASSFELDFSYEVERLQDRITELEDRRREADEPSLDFGGPTTVDGPDAGIEAVKELFSSLDE